jgi:hypothetical protein
MMMECLEGGGLKGFVPVATNPTGTQQQQQQQQQNSPRQVGMCVLNAISIAIGLF